MVHARLYVGRHERRCEDPMPLGAYASCLTSHGAVRRNVQYAESLEEVVKKALRAAENSISSVEIIDNEQRTRYNNLMLKYQGYKPLSQHELARVAAMINKQYGNRTSHVSLSITRRH